MSAVSPQNSSIALVCDWLTTPGGAEKVLLELHKMYPEAPIYTSQYRPKQIDWFKDATVKTGWLNHFPSAFRKILGPLRQSYFSHLDLSHYDLVISVTGAEAKSVRTVAKPHRSQAGSSEEIQLPPPHRAYHICYCHAPTQYYWQKYAQYLKNPGFGFLNPLVRLFFKLLVRPLRKADYRAAQRPDQFVTISRYSSDQIKEYYQRESVIIAPPVEVAKFSAEFSAQKSTSFSTESAHNSTNYPQETAKKSTAFPQQTGNFSTKTTNNSTGDHKFSTSFPQVFHTQPHFIIACRQVNWKRVDLAISACLQAGVPLVVVGAGPEHKKLVKLAFGSPLIEFRPWLSTEELASELRSASAFLFPSLEPFGIAPVEALAAGCPVIAYAVGGSEDFISEGKNGLFFKEQTVDSLANVLRVFPEYHFEPKLVSASAERFAASRFRAEIESLVGASLNLATSTQADSAADQTGKNYA